MIDFKVTFQEEKPIQVNFFDEVSSKNTEFGETQTINIGRPGDSAYDIAIQNGFVGTQEEWLQSLKGEIGPQGIQGPQGEQGAPGKDGKDGADGYTPVKGVDYFDGQNGKDGYTPVKGKDYFDGQNGKDGSPGKDGVSITHRWSEATLYVTSASGTSSANLKGEKGDPGTNGRDGADGQPGRDGIDGKDGYTPVRGVDYFDGKDGADGFSPEVIVEDINSGHRVTIIGKDNTKQFDIMDGKDGTNGTNGTNGKDGADGYAPVKGKDYFTETDKAEMVSAVIAALPIYDGEVVVE